MRTILLDDERVQLKIEEKSAPSAILLSNASGQKTELLEVGKNRVSGGDDEIDV